MRGWPILSLGLLWACGAPPVAPPPTVSLERVGGAPTACLEGDQLRVVQGEVQTRWHLGPDGPTLEATELPGPPACPARGEAPLPGGGRLVWADNGLFLGEALGPLRWWRPAAGRLVAAAFDGEVVRAVGPDGLWQWRPGSAPVPQPLPPELQGLDPTRVFRDGPLLWVAGVDAGAPLEVRGSVPVALAPVAKLPPEDLSLQALLAGRPVEARRGVAGLRIDGQVVPTVGPVTALLPVDDLLFVAAGDALILYRAGPEVVREVPLGGATVALFAAPTPEGGQRLLLVGASYGFGVLTLTR